MPISEFLTFIRFRKEEIPYASEDCETADPSESQIKMASDFLKEITKDDHD